MSFLSPWLLLALFILPGLWWLVRATPPKPRVQNFPSLLLLKKLSPSRQDSAHTPLWLLILRLIALTLLIVAFSRPIYIPSSQTHAPHDLTLVIDNGWAGASHWQEKQKTALALGEATFRAGGHVTLLLSAQETDGHWPQPLHPGNQAALQHLLNNLSPQLWPSNRHLFAQQLQQPTWRQSIKDSSFVLLSDGVAQEGDEELYNVLHPGHSVEDIRWPRCDLILFRITQPSPLQIKAETLPNCPAHKLPLLEMRLEKGSHFTALAQTTLNTNSLQDVRTLLPAPGIADALNLPAISGPAGMLLLRNTNQQHRLGILHIAGDDTPLTGNNFYLKQALQNLSTYQEGTVDTILQQSPSIIIAADGTLPTSSAPALLQWVRQGGMLIRFAGPALAHQTQQPLTEDDAALLPVPLLSGMRQLGGPMSWGKPQKLAPFPLSTPFGGLVIPQDITITRQLLAQPTDDLPRHIWATLADGTPLVTARHEGHGLVVLFHTTPTADWSTLPISGLFPQMLERLITRAPALSASASNKTSDADTLAPWMLLNAQKKLIPPTSTIHALDSHLPTKVDALHPVGFYGSTQPRYPLNLGDNLPTLADEPAMGHIQFAGAPALEHPLWPALLLISLGLIFLDMCLSLSRHSLVPLLNKIKLPFLMAIIGIYSNIYPVHPVYAEALPQSSENSSEIPSVPFSALNIRLAYIETNDNQTNNAVQQGLEGLTHFLNQRSTTHLAPPTHVVPGRDDLAFYPLLYWPITASTHLSPAGKTALNNYLQHNGMLLIDEMGAGSAMDGTSGAAVRHALTSATEGLAIPPLTPLTEQHTLTHSFYLLHDFPGRIAGQTVYVATQSNDESEDVSPIILGNADWAHAWATTPDGQHPYAVIPDGDTQRTLAYRFGFNAIIYALTGNYKNDQRHYPEMLRRLKNSSSSDDTSSDESEAP